MAVDHPKSRGLAAQMVEHAGQHDMLVHVGKIAGMKGVLIIHRLRFRSEGSAGPTRMLSRIPPRTGGISNWSRRQLRLATSGQS